MIEIIGNYWKTVCELNPDAICCTTNKTLNKNKELVMGKGIAKQFAVNFPFLPSYFGEKLSLETNIIVYEWKPTMVAFPTKNHWRENSNLKLIKRSAKELMEIADKRKWSKILITRPGCGNGNLIWEDVKKEIEPYFDGRVFVVDYSK